MAQECRLEVDELIFDDYTSVITSLVPGLDESIIGACIKVIPLCCSSAKGESKTLAKREISEQAKGKFNRLYKEGLKNE